MFGGFVLVLGSNSVQGKYVSPEQWLCRKIHVGFTLYFLTSDVEWGKLVE